MGLLHRLLFFLIGLDWTYLLVLLYARPFGLSTLFFIPYKMGAAEPSRPYVMYTTLFLFQRFHCLFQGLSLQGIGHTPQVVHIVHRCYNGKGRDRYADRQ